MILFGALFSEGPFDLGCPEQGHTLHNLLFASETPPKSEKIVIPFLPLIRKNVFVFFRVLKQLVVVWRTAELGTHLVLSAGEQAQRSRGLTTCHCV